ncbi:hypothetical protein [Mesorhizobium australicum]|uniref:Uncharacterized protein n=1 Tax=Mesorhizobium australicum TaxID=536018 RepID=A0A1X7PWM1_9HYPH|nr:hypothetical protein [Mesorhizobium australicum]SMH56488.1 hypothetical protein SAMN02982922_5556 [Mesorhizobium australicum]
MSGEHSSGINLETQAQEGLHGLLQWLDMQKGGVATFYEFQRRSLALRASHNRQAGLMRLLADLSGRFADEFDGEPLDLSTASQALSQLKAYVREASELPPGDAESLIALINRVGLADLSISN